MYSKSRQIAVWALLPMICVLAASCGDSSESSSSTTVSVGGSVAPTSSKPPVPTGTPFVVGSLNTLTTPAAVANFNKGFEAWADWKNKEDGGINGKPVSVKSCDDKGDAAQADACVQQMIDDQSVMAVQTFGRFAGSSYAPKLATAGLANICNSPNNADNAKGSATFCVTGGVVAQVPGVIKSFIDGGKKKITLILLDAAAAQAAGDVAKAAIQQYGGQVVSTTPYPATATDALPVVAAAHAAKADAIQCFIQATNTKAVLDALQSLGGTETISIPGSAITADVLAAPSAANRLVYGIDIPAPDKADKNYFKLQALADRVTSGDVSKVDGPMVSGWMSGEVIAQAATKVGASVTRSSLLKHLQTQDIVDIPFAPPVMNLKKAPADSPGLANPTTFVVQASGGGNIKYLTGRIDAVTK